MELNVHVKNIPSSTFSFLLNKHATLSWRWACALWTTSMSNFSRRLRTRMCQDWPRDPTRREETAERRSSKVQKAIHRDPSMALRIIPNPRQFPSVHIRGTARRTCIHSNVPPTGFPLFPPSPHSRGEQGIPIWRSRVLDRVRDTFTPCVTLCCLFSRPRLSLVNSN